MEEKINFKGLSSLCFAAIPAALAGAALMWLMFVSGCMDLEQSKVIARRMDNRVGVIKPLTNPVSLVIDNKSCIKITKAFIDEDTVTMYLKNECNATESYHQWTYKAMAPDGTIVSKKYDNTAQGMSNGDVEEHQLVIDEDDRISTIVVYASENTH